MVLTELTGLPHCHAFKGSYHLTRALLPPPCTASQVTSLPPDALGLANCAALPHALWSWHHHTLACQPRCDLHNPAALPRLLDLSRRPGAPFAQQDITSWFFGTSGGGESSSGGADSAAAAAGGSLAALAQGQTTGGEVATAAAATDSQYVVEMVRFFVRHGHADEAPPRDSVEAHAVSSLF